MQAGRIFIWITFLNAFTVIALLIYLPIVFLNLTFTFANLPVTQIPFYAGSSQNIFYSTDRYAYQWFEYASDVLRILPPLMASSALSGACAYGKVAFSWVYNAIIVLLIVIEVLKLFTRGIGEWFFCGLDGFCRPWDPALVSPANYIFMLAFWTGFIFLLLDFAYAYFINQAAQASPDKKQIEKLASSTFVQNYAKLARSSTAKILAAGVGKKGKNKKLGSV